jgi:hypothetical protein
MLYREIIANRTDTHTQTVTLVCVLRFQNVETLVACPNAPSRVVETRCASVPGGPEFQQVGLTNRPSIYIFHDSGNVSILRKQRSQECTEDLAGYSEKWNGEGYWYVPRERKSSVL